MTVPADNILRQHTLKAFDDELRRLQQQVVEMAGLVMYQLEQAMQALDDGDMEAAQEVVERDARVNAYEAVIDNEVIQVLARHCPVADDLRVVVSLSKVAYELEKIGDEVAWFAKLVADLFDPSSSDPNPRLLVDIVKIGNLVKVMLVKLMLAFEKRESAQAYLLLQYDKECESELQQGMRHQLAFILRDVRLIGRAMDIMHIMKTLERCGEHCRNIAEYMIFMIEGIDVRHPKSKSELSAN